MPLEIPVPNWYFLALVFIHIFTVVAFGWVSEEYMEKGDKVFGKGIGLMNISTSFLNL